MTKTVATKFLSIFSCDRFGIKRDASGNGMPGEMALASPKTVAAMLERGVDPNRRSDLGLCWNDFARHVVRPEG